MDTRLGSSLLGGENAANRAKRKRNKGTPAQIPR